MSDLKDLYQEVILDHNKLPRNFGHMDGANRRADGHNPLCGDKLTVYLKVDGDTIRDVGFEGSGCAISKASASMMTEALKGKSLGEVERLFAVFHELVTGKPSGSNGAGRKSSERPALGKLVVFSGVREFPVRVKCASLAWHTMKAALENVEGSISTE